MSSLRVKQPGFVLEWAPWLAVFSIVGYPLVGLFASLMDWDSTVASLPFRIAIVALSLALLGRGALTRRWLRDNRWLLGFWSLYLVRLSWDILVPEIPGATDALVFFVTTALLPGLALGMAGSAALPERRSASLIALVGGTACVLAMTMQYFGLGMARMIDLEVSGGRLFFQAINPISLGHAAVTTLLALLCLTHYRMSPGRRVVLMMVAVAAVAVLVQSASRGPILAALGCLLAYTAATRRWRWTALLTVMLLLPPLLLATDSAVIERFSLIMERFLSSAEDNSGLERLAIQAGALNQFLSSPIFGSAFLELQSLDYPHNLVIETGMSLGVVGLGVLLALVWRGGRLAWQAAGNGSLLGGLLLLQYLLAGQFSGSVWGASAMWVLLAMTLSSSQRIPGRNLRQALPPALS